jgi:hypothetical protein
MAKGKSNGRSKPKTRISADRQPDEQDIAYCEKCGTLDWQREWEKFVNHHLAKGTLMADWNAAWRTWCRNAVDFAAKGNGGGNRGGRPGIVAGTRLFLAALDRRERGGE